MWAAVSTRQIFITVRCRQWSAARGDFPLPQHSVVSRFESTLWQIVPLPGHSSFPRSRIRRGKQQRFPNPQNGTENPVFALGRIRSLGATDLIARDRRPARHANASLTHQSPGFPCPKQASKTIRTPGHRHPRISELWFRTPWNVTGKFRCCRVLFTLAPQFHLITHHQHIRIGRALFTSSPRRWSIALISRAAP